MRKLLLIPLSLAAILATANRAWEGAINVWYGVDGLWDILILIVFVASLVCFVKYLRIAKYSPMGKIKQQKGLHYTEMEPQDITNAMFEDIANKQHEIWSHWMKYQFTKCEPDNEGNLVIPREWVARWKRQMLANYAELSDSEKESDRNVVRNFLVDLVVGHMVARDQVFDRNQDYIYEGNEPRGFRR